MTVTELLANFADPGIIQSLSMTDKLWAGAITTLLGMGITFIALIILQFIISWMDRIINQTGKKVTGPAPDPTADPDIDQNELVAVIASVVAIKMKTSVGNIVIKNIEKIEDRSPAWNRAGIVEQMNSRL